MKLKIIGLLLSFLGQIFILCVFLFVLPLSLFGTASVKWLDFSVLSVLLWISALNASFFRIDSAARSQKAIGGLGIRWSGLIGYATVVTLFLISAVALNLSGTHISFAWQIASQVLLLLLFIFINYAAMTSRQKVSEVEKAEQTLRKGKIVIAQSLQQTVFVAEDRNIPEEVVFRLKRLADDARFLTPSSARESTEADDLIREDCEQIKAALFDYDMNREFIGRLISQLERDMQRRKSM